MIVGRKCDIEDETQDAKSAEVFVSYGWPQRWGFYTLELFVETFAYFCKGEFPKRSQSWNKLPEVDCMLGHLWRPTRQGRHEKKTPPIFSFRVHSPEIKLDLESENCSQVLSTKNTWGWYWKPRNWSGMPGKSRRTLATRWQISTLIHIALYRFVCHHKVTAKNPPLI